MDSATERSVKAAQAAFQRDREIARRKRQACLRDAAARYSLAEVARAAGLSKSRVKQIVDGD